MKITHHQVTPTPQESFRVIELRGPTYKCTWHFYPEFQIALVVRGSGHRIVGDNIAPLEEGELSLLGPNLPHAWQFEGATGKTLHDFVTELRTGSSMLAFFRLLGFFRGSSISLNMKQLASILLLVSAFAVPAQLPTTSPKRAGFDPVRLERVHELIASHTDSGKHAGAAVLIARHGKIVDFQTWGKRDLDSGAPVERDTICRIYSMSKVVTAVAVLQLFEAGKLQLDSPVTHWLPELRDLKVFTGGTADAPQLAPATNAITVRMLLNHTAGFTYDFFAGSPVNDIYKRADLWNSTSLDDFLKRVAKLPLLGQPGTKFNYSIGDDVLGALIQRVSGETFEDYVAHHITGPLRMNDTFFDVPPEKMARVSRLHEIKDGKLRTTPEIIGAYAEKGRGIAAGGAGLFSTIGDYARFAQCLLNGGTLDGVRVLGRKTVELALKNTLPPGEFAFSASEGWGLMSALRLDMALAKEPASEGMFYWSGAATTHFFCDPKEDLVALVFCQHLPFDQHGLFTRFRTAVYQALE